MENHPLEELFRGSRKVLRVLRVLLSEHVPLTKYAIEARAAVYDAGPLLNRLARIGVVKVVEGRPRRYLADKDNPLTRAVERLLRDTGYM